MSGNDQPFFVLTQTHILHGSTEEEFLEEFEEVSHIVELEDVAFVRGVSTGNEKVLVVI